MLRPRRRDKLQQREAGTTGYSRAAKDQDTFSWKRAIDLPLFSANGGLRLIISGDNGIEAAVAYLRTVPETSLLQPRPVGRKQLPSTALGLIFHAAEHSSRHAGQIVTLNRVVRGS